ncbi:DNA-binding transcriptional regulator, AcrR family [Lentzea jiangxiensis]|uniref:DNA-binding transcriptional regulator, AcrR family n=1 Tax=Lentzea jiangxiensis TaxID=641025 RepID=A0A1H0X5M1_9PSEU|nr:DNA-binding transcriptional regulator, AcrR family [Lentzea jiangxiensis]
MSARGSATYRRLLEVAARELAENGDVEVATIARRAGVSVGLPYRYFGTKSGMLRAVVTDFHDRLDEAVIAREFVGDTWAERERARVVAWVDHLYGDPLAPVLLGRLGDADSDGVATQRLHAAIRCGARNVARGQRDGDLHAGRDPELLVAAVLGGVHTAVTVALSRIPRPAPADVAAQLWAFVAGAAGVAERTS